MYVLLKKIAKNKKNADKIKLYFEFSFKKNKKIKLMKYQKSNLAKAQH